MAALIGLDIGTTNCKLIAYSTGGELLAEAVAGYEVRAPEPGHAEVDPGDIMAAIWDVFLQVSPSLAGIGDLSLAISAQARRSCRSTPRAKPSWPRRSVSTCVAGTPSPPSMTGRT